MAELRAYDVGGGARGGNPHCVGGTGGSVGGGADEGEGARCGEEAGGKGAFFVVVEVFEGGGEWERGGVAGFLGGDVGLGGGEEGLAGAGCGGGCEEGEEWEEDAEGGCHCDGECGFAVDEKILE